MLYTVSLGLHDFVGSGHVFFSCHCHTLTCKLSYIHFYFKIYSSVYVRMSECTNSYINNRHIDEEAYIIYISFSVGRNYNFYYREQITN